MTITELTASILKIQAHSKLLLVYLDDDDNQIFAIASLKIIQEEVNKIRDNCVSDDKLHFYVTK